MFANASSFCKNLLYAKSVLDWQHLIGYCVYMGKCFILNHFWFTVVGPAWESPIWTVGTGRSKARHREWEATLPTSPVFWQIRDLFVVALAKWHFLKCQNGISYTFFRKNLFEYMYMPNNIRKTRIAMGLKSMCITVDWSNKLWGKGDWVVKTEWKCQARGGGLWVKTLRQFPRCWLFCRLYNDVSCMSLEMFQWSVLCVVSSHCVGLLVAVAAVAECTARCPHCNSNVRFNFKVTKIVIGIQLILPTHPVSLPKECN